MAYVDEQRKRHELRSNRYTNPPWRVDPVETLEEADCFTEPHFARTLDGELVPMLQVEVSGLDGYGHTTVAFLLDDNGHWLGNAKLIAKSPEMYEMICQAVTEYTETGQISQSVIESLLLIKDMKMMRNEDENGNVIRIEGEDY